MKDNLGALGHVLLTLIALALITLGVWALYKPDEFIRRAQIGKDEFARQAVKVDARKIDPKNQGKPVIVTGEITCKDVVKDNILGAKFPGAISAYRDVTMRQNDEKWEGSGDNERMVGYVQTWSDEVIPCPGRPNPAMPLTSQFFMGTTYKVGAFTIPREMAADLEGKTVAIPELHLDNHFSHLGRWETGSKYITLKRSARGDEVGNVRLRYMVQEPCQVTVLGVQQGDRIEPFIDGSGSQTYAIMKGPPTATATKKAIGDDEALPSMGWARFRAAWPLLLGFSLLFYQKWGRQSGPALMLVLAAMAVALVMFLVHQAVWKVLPNLVL